MTALCCSTCCHSWHPKIRCACGCLPFGITPTYKKGGNDGSFRADCAYCNHAASSHVGFWQRCDLFDCGCDGYTRPKPIFAFSGGDDGSLPLGRWACNVLAAIGVAIFGFLIALIVRRRDF